MEERYKIRVVVDILLERENVRTNKKEILLLLRKDTGHKDGFYDLPGGHLEANEDLVDAMRREAKEEIGIEIEREDLQMVLMYHHYKKDILKFVYKANKYKNEIKNCEPDKCKELKWFEIENLPENIIPKIKQEIENIEKNIYYYSDV